MPKLRNCTHLETLVDSLPRVASPASSPATPPRYSHCSCRSSLQRSFNDNELDIKMASLIIGVGNLIQRKINFLLQNTHYILYYLPRRPRSRCCEFAGWETYSNYFFSVFHTGITRFCIDDIKFLLGPEMPKQCWN